MRPAARHTLLAVTLGLSSACGAAQERELGARGFLPRLPPSPLPAPVFVAVDSDRDGVLDPYDACPGLPGVLSRVIVLNGCPPPGYYDDGLGTHDRDGDGVLDDADTCPEDPGPPEMNGCAVPPDSDGDGVTDATDACRGAAGPPRDDARFTGCPAAWLEGERIRILEQVRFASGSAELLPESTPVLEAVAGVLSSRSDVTKVRVEGHTDGRGGVVMNRRLSLGRAARVARFLTDHGIAGTRLDAEGIGPDKPLDSNETEQGRATNRRVEFHVVGVADPSSTPTALGGSPGPPKTDASVGIFADPGPGPAPAAPAPGPLPPESRPAATLDSSGF